MENEIKVNEYVRTKYGEIGIVTGTHPRLKWRKKKASSDLDFNSIVKHSTNLIDLIECGDYVNGKEVSNVDKVDNINFIEWTDGDMYKTEVENDKFIKTIVTKEMMEYISYKVTKM